MNSIDDLELRRATEISRAVSAACPEKRNEHEQQARAFGKIINVLHREGREAATRSRTRSILPSA